MKTVTFLVLLTLGTGAIAQVTNTNRAPYQVPSRAIRLENEGTNPATTAAPLPLRNPAANGSATNLAAAATNLASAATNLAAAATNIAGAATTTNRLSPLPGRGATNVVTAPRAGPPVPGIPAPRPATAAATGVAPTPAPATPLTAVSINVPGGEDIIPPGLIKFQDAELLQVLEFYQDLTGRTVIRPATLPPTKISVRTQTPLTRREAVQLLDSILSMNQISMTPQGEKFVKAVPSANVQMEARAFNQLAHGDLPESGSIVAQVVQLSNAAPREVAQALQPFAKLPNSIVAIDAAGILILRDYSENVKRMMEMLEKIDVVPQQEFEPVVIPIKYALASDMQTVLSSLTAGGGGGTTVGQQQTRSGLSGAGAGGFRQPGAGGFGGAGQPGMQGYNPQGTTSGVGGAGGFGSPTAGRSSFANRLQQIVNRAATSGDIVVLGNTKIIADDRTNSLLVFATKTDYATITNIIAKLDVVLAQVLIEALVLEVGLNESEEYGISYLQRAKKLGGGGQGAGALINRTPSGTFADVQALSTNLFGGFSYFASWGDFDVALKAAASDGRVSVLSRPRIQTSHAEEANLFVGETRPYPTSSQFGSIYGNYAQIQQLQIGITLSVRPLINADGLVVMDIRQKIQDVGEDVQIQGVGAVPSTIDREANAKVSVRDGETIVLGGLISHSRSKSKQGVPFLKDIPILGWLFRSSDQSSRRRELMVFIRPTVLPTPESAAIAATAEKERLPGISQAEWEISEAERKRLEQYQRKKDERHEQTLRSFDKSQPDPDVVQEAERARREAERLAREQEKTRRELFKKEGFQE